MLILRINLLLSMKEKLRMQKILFASSAWVGSRVTSCTSIVQYRERLWFFLGIEYFASCSHACFVRFCFEMGRNRLNSQV